MVDHKLCYQLNFIIRALIRGGQLLEQSQGHNPTLRIADNDTQAIVYSTLFDALEFARLFLANKGSEICESSALIKTYIPPTDKCVLCVASGELGIIELDSVLNLKPTDGLIKDALESNKVIARNVSDETEYIHSIDGQSINYPSNAKPKSAMAVPVIFGKSSKLGVIYFQSSKLDFFSDTDDDKFLLLGTTLASIFKHDPMWKSNPFI